MVNLNSIKISKYIIWSGVAVLLLSVALCAYTGNFLFLAVPFPLAGLVWVFLDWKSFYWFFIFTIPLSCEIQLGPLSTTVPDEQMMWIFVPLVILILAFNIKRFPKWYINHPLTLIVFLQFIWLLVAVGYSQNHFLSFKFLAAKSWFLISYFVMPALIFREKKDIKKAFLLFAIPALIHAAFAFTWHYFLHFDYWASNDVVKPFYRNHVDYSTVLSMLFPLVLMAYQLSKGNKKHRKLLLATLIFLVPAISVAGARAAILGVMFSFVIAFAVRKRFVNVVLPAFFIFIGSMFFYLSHDHTFVRYRPNIKYTATQRTFGDLLTATFRGTDMSSMERFYRWIAATRMSADHPWIGVGPNNFYDYYKPYTSSMFKTWVSRNEERSTTHDYFLLMLVEQGWPATILYGILVMAIFGVGQKIYHKTNDIFFKKATLGILMMFAAGFINNFFSELVETHKFGALFYFAISMLVIINQMVNKQNEKQLLAPQNGILL